MLKSGLNSNPLGQVPMVTLLSSHSRNWEQLPAYGSRVLSGLPSQASGLTSPGNGATVVVVATSVVVVAGVVLAQGVEVLLLGS